jgi:preprotein translocase subunit SecE
VSDEPDRPGSDDDGNGAVVTRPTRPTGKRSRRAAVGEDASEAVDLDTGTKAAPTKNGSGGGKKTAKRGADQPSRNPFAFVWNYLTQVVAELRKVIWPNRQQMITYTTVVLLFLAFMVALISLTDLGLTKVIVMIFGDG